jgi:hypothetical protein
MTDLDLACLFCLSGPGVTLPSCTKLYLSPVNYYQVTATLTSSGSYMTLRCGGGRVIWDPDEIKFQDIDPGMLP